MLIAPDALEERRRAISPGGPLAPLYESLTAELEPWLTRSLHVPQAKALLSRMGGRCEADGTPLDFDPASPHEHRCPTCRRVHTGELHHRAWVMPYQLWLAERGLQAALFFLLRGDERHARFSRDVLQVYSARYTSYPNVDNVLGPSRLFFSTYLESVWLLQVCLAAGFLSRAGDDGTEELVRRTIVEPARAMIAEYDEGMSNRQVWNNAALIAAALACGDESAVAERAFGPSGVHAHLTTGVLADGSWYEGENYHQFALRGLWYAVTLLEGAGIAIDAGLQQRYERAFAIPVLTALPDFTMPSRKDSQYAVSLRQWRMAELLELGVARRRDPLLLGALARCYEPGHERRDIGRSRSTADIERNGPSGALTRADLGWRALLHALPELPRARAREPRSAVLPNQGYAVFRRENDTYVGFEFGQSGGGHGHPDRLNITLYRNGDRLLDDLGTGSYVDPSLHWYRSTLAHNAPLVDGRSQPLRDAQLVAREERDGIGWIIARLNLPEHGVRLERSLVITPDYLVDELRWTADRPVTVDVPWHLGAVTPAEAQPMVIPGGTAPADGFTFLKGVARLPRPVDTFTCHAHEGRATLALHAASPVEIYFAAAPGQPAQQEHGMVLARGTGATGVIHTVIAWTGVTVQFGASALTVETRHGERHVHRRDDRGWHVELQAGGARSSIDLAGFVDQPESRTEGEPMRRVPIRVHRSANTFSWLSERRERDTTGQLEYALGERHYRRSETSWEASGRPVAQVVITATGESLVIHGLVHAGDAVFAPADARNPYDNEHPDTMAAGVQLHLRDAGESSSWMLVPEPDPAGAVRVRPVTASARAAPVARWRPVSDGWEFRIDVPLPPGREIPIALDVIINETIRGRARRRGQLVLSGAQGEWAYLRGDRQGDEHLVPMVIVP